MVSFISLKQTTASSVALWVVQLVFLPFQIKPALKFFTQKAPTVVSKPVFLNIKNGEVNELSLQTLAEKCVWSAKNTYIYCTIPRTITNARYPDDWYQGRVNFEDSIWQIDTLTGANKLLVDTVQQKNSLDAINLNLDPEEKYIIFTNKTDSKLGT